MNSTLPAVEPLLETLASQLSKRLNQDKITNPLPVGIHTGGLWIAQALAKRGVLPESPGEIDIGFHRDDYGRQGIQNTIRSTRLGPTEGRDVVLVDDVLHSGRTVRAALNILFEYGRPNRIMLACLISRDGRQLPIQADVVGAELSLAAHQRVKLIGPDPLQLVLKETESG